MPRLLLLVVPGFAALLLGGAVYALERQPGAVWLHPAVLSWPAAHGSLPVWLHASLPSAAHVLAFSLLLAAVLPRRLRLPGCAAWCGLDMCLEVAQHPQVHRGLVEHGLSRWPAGTFDPADLLATALGSLLAAALVTACNRRVNALGDPRPEP